MLNWRRSPAEASRAALCHAQVSVEAGSTFGWERYVGQSGKAIGVDHYGASAPAPILYEKFGITKAAAVEAAKAQM